MIRNLVITRVPFQPPQGSMEDLFARARTQSGPYAIPESKARTIFQFQQYMQAVIKMRQGVGRLLRAPDDDGTLWIGDPRFPRTPEGRFGVLCSALSSRFHRQLETAPVFNAQSGDVEPQPEQPQESLKEFMLL